VRAVKLLDADGGCPTQAVAWAGISWRTAHNPSGLCCHSDCDCYRYGSLPAAATITCGWIAGRLRIQGDGTMAIVAEDGNLYDAQCYTSLDGVSFVQ